jgi:RNA-directed DNA polymerase
MGGRIISESAAVAVKAALQARLSECQLELHPTKTRIVYCKVVGRRGMYPNVTFDFLGYCFRPRRVMRPSDRKVVGGFTPAVSPTALTAMRATIRDLNIRRRTHVSLADIAQQLNPLLRGWVAYYGRYTPSALYPLYRYVNLTLLVWVQRKFKRYKAHKVRAACFLEKLARTRPELLVHWRLGMIGAFA